jgi:hypothetical protein
VNQAIEDRIGERGIVAISVPLLDVELTGDDRGGSVLAIIEDFREVTFGLVGERRNPKVLREVDAAHQRAGCDDHPSVARFSHDPLRFTGDSTQNDGASWLGSFPW